MKRYHFLSNKDVYEALNGLRDAFLAAKDGNEVNEIINGLLTRDEQMKIGRRILISEVINDLTSRDIVQISRIGKTTLALVSRLMDQHPKCFELIHKRRARLEKEYEAKKTRSYGGSKLVFKKKKYTGIKRSDISR